jgi:hypothetical protein
MGASVLGSTRTSNRTGDEHLFIHCQGHNNPRLARVMRYDRACTYITICSNSHN